MEQYDVVVLGGGPGGYVAAVQAATHGLKTVLIEKYERLGGTCLNVGCIPSKALLESSELYHKALHEFALHGLNMQAPAVDLPVMQGRKSRIVNELTDGILQLMKTHGVEVIRGFGALTAEKHVEVQSADSTRTIAGEHIILAVGSRVAQLPSLPIDGTRVVNSTHMLAMETIPKRLVVVGAGAIGLELGSVCARLGSQVSVVEYLSHIAPFAEKQVAKTLERSLKKSVGMTFHLNSKVSSITHGEHGVTCIVEGKRNTLEIECEQVLVSVGRVPATENIGLQAAGVACDDRGRIVVDQHFATTIPGIYAIGDAVDGPMLAHKAEHEGLLVADAIAGKLPADFQRQAFFEGVPSVVYTEPELAQVGLTEQQAKERGYEVKCGKAYFAANGRAKSLQAEEGLVKLVCRADSGQVLGAHIVGPRASELIAEAVLAMKLQASAHDIAHSVHAHPTLSEAVKEAARTL